MTDKERKTASLLQAVNTLSKEKELKMKAKKAIEKAAFLKKQAAEQNFVNQKIKQVKKKRYIQEGLREKKQENNSNNKVKRRKNND